MTLEPTWSAWLAYLEAGARFVFLNWAAGATVLLLMGLGVARLPRLKASTRHAVLLGALLLSAAAPVLRLVPLPERVVLVQPAPAAAASRPAPARRQLSAPGPARVTGFPPAHLGVLLLGGWALVAGLRLVRLGFGAWAAGRLLRGAIPAERGRLYDACGYALADLPILETERVTVPSVLGVWRQHILLPVSLSAELSLEQLGHVLRHEEAHARRRDPLFLFLAEGCHALLFWHPLAGLVRREMEAAAEDACDAHVLARGADGPAYARTLLQVVVSAAPAPRRSALCTLGAASRRRGAVGELRRRVVRILDGVPRPSPWTTAVAGAGLLAALSGITVAELGRRPEAPRSAQRLQSRVAGTRQRQRRNIETVRRVPQVAIRQAPAVSPPVVALARYTPELKGSPALLPATVQEADQPFAVAGRSSTPRESRCLVLVLDNSSSMKPYREEARRQVMAQVRSLAPGDRFNVVAFSSEVVAFAEAPVAPVESSFAGVDAWLMGLPEGHGTDVKAGISRALAMPEVSSVVLVSDGQTSENPVIRAELVALLERENRSGARVLAMTLGEQPGEVTTASPGTETPQPGPDRKAVARSEQELRP